MIFQRFRAASAGLHRVLPGRQTLLPAAGIGLTLLLAMPTLDAAGKGRSTVDKIEYKGWKHNLRISNGVAELIVTLDVGPRIISYRLADGPNVFKEFTEQLGHSGEKDWQSRGGHRLWVGPEDLTRTYAADNGPVQYQQLPSGGVRFTPAPETEYGIQKSMDVFLDAHSSQVKVVHHIKNIGDQATELAPWALTVMAAGGVEIIPLPAHKPHPGPPKNAQSPKDFAASEILVLWPFFDFTDPRWTFGSRYIMLRQDPGRGPTKIGMAQHLGWACYLNQGNLFVKHVEYQEDQVYPDHGCNFETFSNEEMLEMESLGPLAHLAPGKTVDLTEHWQLVKNEASVKKEADVNKHILPHVLSK